MNPSAPVTFRSDVVATRPVSSELLPVLSVHGCFARRQIPENWIRLKQV